ncbi:MAG: AAA family ATPase, partial [Bacteroidales bacterium]|nr:AAA family ATPase [Bacteroidales bacterium]
MQNIYLAMLLRYTVENFLSFNGRAVFSMIPGKGSLKKDHRSTPINDISALKASIILGANASGKSNLIKAIDFGRRMVVRGQKDGQILDYKKYRLDTDSAEKDSRMEFEIQAAGKNYAYGFVFNNQFIVEEWLYEISRRSQKMIFERSMKSDPIFNLTPMLKK